jgi:hypothetical protein
MKKNNVLGMAVLWAVAMVMVGLGCPVPVAVDDDVCDPGKTELCACPDGGQGAQVCDDDGGGWGYCACGGGDDDDATPTDDDDDNTPSDDDDNTPPDDDDAAETVYLTVNNWTSYSFDVFLGWESGAWWDLLGYGTISPGYTFTSEYYIWPGYWTLYVEDVTGYWAQADCPYMAAGGWCYWDVYDSDMQP